MTPAKAPPKRRPRRSPTPEVPSPPVSIDGRSIGAKQRIHPNLGLGLWALGRWTHDDEVATKATLAHALERGIRWFDTAEVYGSGRSERILGDVLLHTPAPPEPVFLTTKVSWEHLRPRQVRPALLGSLQRLGRNQVELYLVHAPDPRVPLSETMPALEELWKERRIGEIGVSNFSVDQMAEARAALKETDLVVNQVRYNLFDRREASPILDYCRENGILIEAYTPLARGVLTGRYLDGSSVAPDVRRLGRDLFEGDRFPDIVRRAKELRALAAKEGVPMASLALHWLARQEVAPLFGASRPAQVDEILAAWAQRPSDAALDRAEEITRDALG